MKSSVASLVVATMVLGLTLLMMSTAFGMGVGPSPDGKMRLDAPVTGGNRYGLDNRGPWGSGNQLMVDSGATWIRQEIRWNQVQPSKDTSIENWDWSQPDDWFKTMTQNGMIPIPYVDEAPSDLANPTCGPFNQVSSYKNSYIKKFMAAAAERYDGDKDTNGDGIDEETVDMPQVDFWGFYNEPDSNNCWGQHGSEYAQMLSAVYPVMKDANPNVQIVFGGVAGYYSGTTFNFDLDGGDFVDNVFDYIVANPGNYYDWFDLHYYATEWQTFEQDWTSAPANEKWLSAKVHYYQGRMDNHTGTEKPFIVTEVGRRTEADCAGGDGNCSVNGEAASNGATGRFLWKANVQAAYEDLAVVNLFSFADTSTYITGSWGLAVNATATKSPTYNQYVNSIDALAGWDYRARYAAGDVENHVFNPPGTPDVCRTFAWSQTPTAANNQVYDVEIGGSLTYTNTKATPATVDDTDQDGHITLSVKDPIYVNAKPDGWTVAGTRTPTPTPSPWLTRTPTATPTNTPMPPTPTATPTLYIFQKQLTGSLSDAYDDNIWNDGALYTNTTTIKLGYTDRWVPYVYVPYHDGFRLTSVTIPHGATILSATLSIYVEAVVNGVPQLAVSGEVGTPCLNYSDSHTYPSYRDTFMNEIIWDLTDDIGWQTSSNIKNAIQDQVNQEGWDSGDPLCINIFPTWSDPPGSVNWRVKATSYDGNPIYAAKLYIEYSVS